jgi:hypothetical protein
MQKNVSGQKWRVFAFNLTDNVPVTGDSANITGKINIDGAGAGAIADTNPTEIEDGYYEFDLSQGETDGDNLDIYPESSTGDVQVIGVPGNYVTTPPNHSIMYIPFQISDVDLANSAAVPLGFKVIDLYGDLPTTAEITPGSIVVARKAIGGAAFSIITNTACSKNDGYIYNNEVFSSGRGYFAGDSIWVRFYNQKVTINSIEYILSAAQPYSMNFSIRQTMRGTDAAGVNTEMLDVLTIDTFAEVGQETPAATQSILKMLQHLYKQWRNKHSQTATEYKLYADDTTTVDQKRNVSDDTVTATKEEIAAGP